MHAVLMGDAERCTAHCQFIVAEECVSGDGCCPGSCSPGSDEDCSWRCGNEVIDPGETCDGDCPAACVDGNDCTEDLVVGSAANCSAECAFVPISDCTSGDGCCPLGCEGLDDDCPDDRTCGNGAPDPGETCDGDCPVDCVDSDPCTHDLLAGDAETCTAECWHQPITWCAADDGCCPSGCNADADSDCTCTVCGRHTVPGVIQAEDYRDGGEGVGYHDSSPTNLGGACRNDAVDKKPAGEGCSVGWFDVGEWLAYDVSIANSGYFDVSVRYGREAPGPTTLYVEVDGQAPGHAIELPSTGGWETFETVVSHALQLPAGDHFLTVRRGDDWVDIDWLGFAEGVGPICGNGAVEAGESCDDGNTAAGDGCAADCRSIEAGFTCPAPGQPCEAIETCDFRVDAYDEYFGGNTETPILSDGADTYITWVDQDLMIRVAKNCVQGDFGFAVDVDPTHKAPSIGMDPDGYLHLTGGHHNDGWNYWRSATPRSLDFVERGPLTQDSTITYAGFANDIHGDLYVSYRFAIPQANKQGSRAANIATYDPSTEQWTTLGGERGVFWMPYGMDSNGSGIRWYQPMKVTLAFDPSNTMHASCCVNDGNVFSAEMVFYAYYRDGVFHRSDGTPLALPIDNQAGAFVVTDIPQPSGWDCMVLWGGARGAGVTYRGNNVQYLAWQSDGWVASPIPNGVNAQNNYSTSRGDVLLSVRDAWRMNGVDYPRPAGHWVQPVDKRHFESTGDIRYLWYHGGFAEVYTIEVQ